MAAGDQADLLDFDPIPAPVVEMKGHLVAGPVP